ncbi:MAG: tetratricopeptide repeat protein [Acidobacteria bacterium]|nr:tetratricopeptide repeat protein [Acidobacteriota bacterium]
MLRGFWRGASLAILAGLALSLVACSQYNKLQAVSKFKDGNAQYRLQEYKKAAKLYEEAVAADPEIQFAYFFLASSYDNMYKPARKGEKENDEYLTKAIEYYKKSAEVEKDPTYKKRAMEFLVAAYGPDKMNDPSQQLPIVEKMIQTDPQDTSSYFQLAKIHEDAGEYDKAEAVLLKAKEARPNDPNVFLQLGGFYNRQEEFGKTIEALTQRATIEPNNPEAYYTIATYYWDKAYRDFRLKEPEKKQFVSQGMTAIDKALQLKPDYMEAITYKGLLLRLQATFEKDAARQSALLKEAEKLQNEAKELQKKKLAGVTK